jgi:hypothetical protein
VKTEFRIIFTATFDTAAERDKAYEALKTGVASAAIRNAAFFKRADMTKDEYPIPDNPTASEKVI